MGFLGNLFGGSSGMGWRASGTNIAQPTTTGQAETAYGQTQQGLQQQQAFLRALQGQGGLQNQSSVFNQYQDLADLMKGVATGTGPNPALAQLNQTTGKNIAATTAAIAGARGAGSNPALATRTAARLGSETQQNAAAEAATLAAQQQIAGMDALSRQQQGMASLANQQVANEAAATNAYSTAAQNQQQNLLASINAQNQANVAMQSNINQANAGINAITAQGQQGLLGGLLGGAGAAMGLTAATGGRVKLDQIGNNPRAYADGGDVEPVERTNKPKIDDESKFNVDVGVPAASGAGAIQKGMTQLGSGIGKASRGTFGQESRSVPEAKLDMPEMGSSMRQAQSFMGTPAATPKTIGSAGTLGASSGFRSPEEFSASTQAGIDRENYPGAYQSPGGLQRTPVLGAFAGGGKVPALLSPGEKYLTPEQAQDVLKGKENPLNGKTIPGKAVKKGDSYDNDIVPATLEEGGCVIPRSVLQSDQPMKNAIKFVHQHMKKMAKGGKVENKKQEQKVEKQEAGEQVPMHVASEVLKNPHMLFSPANALFKKTLDLTPDEVLGLIQSKGIIAEPAIGKYGEVEPSIVVHNVAHHHVPFLMDLAKQLGQESAILSSNGKHEAHYLNGPNTGKVARGMGTIIHDKEPENFYTKTKNGLIFSHDIDWGKLHDK